MSDIEIKQLSRPFEIKEIDEQGQFSGYGAMFGNMDSYRDIIERGAFKRTLAAAKKKKRWPAMLWQHKTDCPVGVFDEMHEDETGLFVSGRLAINTEKGRDAYELLKMGAISGMSIGYSTVKCKYDEKQLTRTLLDVELYEVSLVTMPANDDARVSSVKSIKTIREFEAFLREEGGFSNAAAKAISSRGFKAGSEPRDEDERVSALLASATKLINPR